MDAKPVQRRLAAVLAADVAGYARMMQIKPIDPERIWAGVSIECPSGYSDRRAGAAIRDPGFVLEEWAFAARPRGVAMARATLGTVDRDGYEDPCFRSRRNGDASHP